MKKSNILYKIGNLNNIKKTIKISIILFIIVSIAGVYFVNHNERYYSRTIAKITSITVANDKQVRDLYGNVENIYTQHINAVIMNGIHEGQKIELQNNTSESHVFDTSYEVNDEVFISYHEDSQKSITSASILDLKRDKYMVYILIIFIILAVVVGGYKGLRSLASVSVNILVSYIFIEFYIARSNVFLITAVASLIFIVLSILLVNGINKKSSAAIMGTVAGTLFSLLLTLIVIAVTNGSGIHYEEMDYLPYDSNQLFIAEIIIGALGGIIDIAITISSAIKEILDKNPDIEVKTLIKSGQEIGKDIMGSMANILIFAYVSGSIPMIILWLKNGYSLFNIINYNLSLELIRALTGSIGIVISIPITIYISVFLLRDRRTGACV